MRVIVIRAAILAAAAAGLTAIFLLPLGLVQHPATTQEALRMPAASKETTVSVFPALIVRQTPRAAPVSSVRPPVAAPRSPLVRRGLAPPISPQTDERLLAELGPSRPDDRSTRLLVPE